MKKNDTAFWALVVSFVFGTALHWPNVLRLAVILFAAAVLAQAAARVVRAYGAEV